MYYEKKSVKDPFQSTLNDLKLFEQTNYCLNYLKNNYSNVEESVIQNHSEIASASFRQASEYYRSAINSSIYTSPLLFSYAMNNLLKGVCYLKSFDNELLDGFKSHGFKVDSKNLKDDMLSSKITIMKRFGAVQSLLKMYNNSLVNQDISLNKLLRHIPGIDRYYYESVGSISLIGENSNDGENTYIFQGDNYDAEVKDICKLFHMVLYSNHRDGVSEGWLNMRFEEELRKKKFSESDVFYKNYLNISERFEDGLKNINISFYCYLLIMSFGMMVRYNPNIWERYIDKKTSKFSTLIELSIDNSIIHFYYQMHYLLFGFYYEDNTYKEIDIKRIIKQSTPDIMNNITKKVRDLNFVNSSHYPLPWIDNVR